MFGLRRRSVLWCVDRCNSWATAYTQNGHGFKNGFYILTLVVSNLAESDILIDRFLLLAWYVEIAYCRTRKDLDEPGICRCIFALRSVLLVRVPRSIHRMPVYSLYSFEVFLLLILLALSMFIHKVVPHIIHIHVFRRALDSDPNEARCSTRPVHVCI